MERLIIFFVFVILFYYTVTVTAVQGSFTISKNESSKFPSLPKIPQQEENETEKRVCVFNWQCSDWGECKNFFQSRECTDINYCSEEKPTKKETRACVPKTVEEFFERTTPLAPIPYWTITLFLLILLLLVLVWILRRIIVAAEKRKKKKEKVVKRKRKKK